MERVCYFLKSGSEPLMNLLVNYMYALQLPASETLLLPPTGLELSGSCAVKDGVGGSCAVKDGVGMGLGSSSAEDRKDRKTCTCDYEIGTVFVRSNAPFSDSLLTPLPCFTH